MVKTSRLVKFPTLKLPTRLHKVYILPNNLGLYYIGLWSTSFLLSVGYASNLLLFIAILQFALFFWWMITAHSDLSQLKISHITIENAFADESKNFTIEWNNPLTHAHLSSIVLIDTFDKKYPLDFLEHYGKKTLTLKIHQRGFYHFKKIEVNLLNGFWLFKTWKYLAVDVDLYVYPKPVKPPHELTTSITITDPLENIKQQSIQPLELDLLKETNNASRPNRIDWKRFAQKSILVERFGETGHRPQLILDFDQMRNELDLSYNTHQLLYFFENQYAWTIKYQGQIIGPFNLTGNSGDDLHLCLKMLATHTF